MAGATGPMRGLAVFIADIRASPNKDAERARVDKELANIRTKFKSEKQLTAYDRKKYVWKMLYIYMLGYDVDFGHMEAVGLISAAKYAEKQVGYVVTTVLLNEDHEFLRLVINTMRNDIISNDENFQCLALTAVSNLGGKEFAEAMSTDVQRLLVSTTVRPIVRKKAALCLLRLYRKNPDTLAVESWAEQMCNLLDERHVGVLTAVMTLLLGLVSQSPSGYEMCASRVVKVLERITKGVDVPKDYTYYAIPSPWLQVKTMRVLHYFDPPEDPEVMAALNSVLATILGKSETVKSVNKNNAVFAILFEAISLVMHLEANAELMGQAVNLLASYIAVKEPNIRYLALENMSRLSLIPEMMEAIRGHQGKIVESLKDPDISIRRRALDLLYGMCDTALAKDIVAELLAYLVNADFAIREELTLKIAILSERFASDLQWYIDVMMQLIEKAGDFVSDDVWFRVVQIVTNNRPLQPYTVQRVVEAMRGQNTHEMMVKVACYILGEFGHTFPSCSPGEMFDLLHDKFPSVSMATKGLLLSSYVKLCAKPAASGDTALKARVQAVFEKYHSYVDCEIQQRSVEYSVLASINPSFSSVILEDMPHFPERESALLKQVEKADAEVADVSVASIRKQSAAAGTAGAGIATQAIGDVLGGDADLIAGTAQPDNGSSLMSDLSSLEAAMNTPAPAAAAAAVDPFAPPAATAAAAPVVDPFAAPTAAAPTAEAASADPFAAAAVAGADPFADAGFGAPAPPVPESLPAAQATGSIDEWYRKLLVNDNGVLYEDQYIQVGLRCQFGGPSASIQAFFGNKSTHTITNIVFDIASTAEVVATASSPVPQAVESRQQVRAQVDLQCTSGFHVPPSLSFSYRVGSLDVSPAGLRSPIVMTKFITPNALEAQDFFGRWKAIASPPQKLQEIVQTAKDLSVAQTSALFGGCRMKTLSGLDPNPNNIVAAGVFGAVACLARLEVDPNSSSKFRLTIASDDANVAAGVFNTVKYCMQPV